MKKITKTDIENLCRKAGMRPAARGQVDGVEVFVADGVSKYPHRDYKRFGVSPLAYPHDLNVTMWFTGKGEDGFQVGSFDFTKGLSRIDRIKGAIDDATDFVKRQKNGRKDH